MKSRPLNKKRSGASLFLICVCLCVMQAPARSSQGTASNLTVSSDLYSVRVISEEFVDEACYLKRFTLELKDKTRAQSRYITIGGLHSRIRSIGRLHLLEGDSLVVHGKLKRADAISIIDPKNGQVTDQFWCYQPVFSPSKGFLVYEKFYPYHGLAPTQTTVVLIYDMQKPPMENRVPAVGYTEWPKEQVGLPVYPEPYVKARAYVLVEQQLQNIHWYMRSSPFLWSEDANDVVFLCNHKKQTYIVRVNISAGIDKPKIFEAPLNVGNFLKPELPEEYRKKEAARLHTVSATHIIWDGKDHVLVKPNTAYFTLQDKIRLPVP